MKKQRKKKKLPADLTTRNARHYNRELKQHDKHIANLWNEVFYLRSFAVGLIDILKSKRLLTPAQCKMLEDCLK